MKVLAFFSASHWARLKRGVVGAVIVACVGLLIEFVTEGTPFSEMTRHLAARLFAPYNAYFYGGSDPARAITDRIVMVDLGAATLQRYRTAWPIAYGQHARILERIRQAQPAAVFVDFRFEASRPDPSLAALASTLCAFKAEGIPVFLAAGSQATRGVLRPELEALRDATGAPCFQKVAVDYEPSATDRISWTYPLRREVGETTLPSAALAMAQSVTPARLLGDATTQPTMGLVWGGGPADNGPRWMAQAAQGPVSQDARGDSEHERERYCKGPSWTDLVPLQNFVMRITQRPIDQRPHCPLHRGLEAGELTAPGTAEQVQARLDAMRGKLVFYGGSFDANDFVASPLQGDLPGVYLHAQAADNLLRYGTAWRHAQIGGRLGHAYEWPMAFLALLAMALLAAATRRLLGVAGRCAWVGIQPGVDACARSRVWRALFEFFSGARDGLFPPEVREPPAPAARRESLARAVRHLGKKLHHVGSNLAGFYVSLLVALPVTGLLLEPVLHVSVIGYSSILALCLLGELFTDMAQVDDEGPGGSTAGGTPLSERTETRV